MELRVAKVPADKSGLTDLVADLVQSCVKQGARDLVPLEKPLSYTEQVEVLKDKGLLGNVTPADVPDPANPPSQEEQDLLAAHRSEV